MTIEILKQSDITTAFQKQVTELFKQLSNRKQIELAEVLKPENQISLVYCMENEKIIGIASMCFYRVISGYKGWVEDVVVDAEARGKGVGKKLIEKLLEIAGQKGLTEVLLFTEDHRVPAINLYQKLGFKLKDSRIYVLNAVK